MDHLEKFINQNRNLFDDVEPDPGHFKRFEARLKKEERRSYFTTSRPVMLRIAASLLILVAVSLVFAYVARKNFSGVFPAGQSAYELSPEVKDALSYYDGRVNEKMTRIRNLEKTCPAAKEITSKASKQINVLDAASDDLKNTLKENPENERVVAALIRNQQMKETILDDMIRTGCSNSQ